MSERGRPRKVVDLSRVRELYMDKCMSFERVALVLSRTAADRRDRVTGGTVRARWVEAGNELRRTRSIG